MALPDEAQIPYPPCAIVAQGRFAEYRAARGAYKNIEQLPEREGELQYRIKNAAEEHERIAFESELRAF
jgi:hypothetical protein